MNNYFILDKNTVAIADKGMANPTVKKLWHSFCLCDGELCFDEGAPNTFVIGNTALPDIPSGKEFAVRVDAHGIAVAGSDYGGLVRGFVTVLLKIEYETNRCKIAFCEETSEYKLSRRMLHLCFFPENDLYAIKKQIRLAALCQYTHIVLEFWGMLKYDCLRELSWSNALTKAQAREFIDEMRELGIEPIPMFNQLGHASACRSCNGKHVVLDQNPRLQHLFTPDGWVWNIESSEVASLLKSVRAELYELFGEGEFTHLGFDEAGFISNNPKLRQKLPDYLAAITAEVEREGRRPMLWMDMLLEWGKFTDCCASGKADEVEKLRSATAKSTVFVDWQYDCRTFPIPSLLSLKDCDHDVIGAPWFNAQNQKAHIETLTQNGMFGIMLTAWHALKDHMPSLVGCSLGLGAKSFSWQKYSPVSEITATLLRRVSFEGNTYEDCGWSKNQINI